jgi:hypothetical protein
MKDNLVKIAQFSDTFTADLARNSLETSGIDCFMAGEQTTMLRYPGVSNGISIEVRKSDAKRAFMVLLAEGFVSPPSNPMAALPSKLLIFIVLSILLLILTAWTYF